MRPRQEESYDLYCDDRVDCLRRNVDVRRCPCRTCEKSHLKCDDVCDKGQDFTDFLHGLYELGCWDYEKELNYGRWEMFKKEKMTLAFTGPEWPNNKDEPNLRFDFFERFSCCRTCIVRPTCLEITRSSDFDRVTLWRVIVMKPCGSLLKIRADEERKYYEAKQNAVDSNE
jgi:hypothetical protein